MSSGWRQGASSSSSLNVGGDMQSRWCQIASILASMSARDDRMTLAPAAPDPMPQALLPWTTTLANSPLSRAPAAPTSPDPPPTPEQAPSPRLDPGTSACDSQIGSSMPRARARLIGLFYQLRLL